MSFSSFFISIDQALISSIIPIYFVLTQCLCLQHRILDSMPQSSSDSQETEPLLSRKGCQGSYDLFPGDGILPGETTLVAEPVSFVSNPTSDGPILALLFEFDTSDCLSLNI